MPAPNNAVNITRAFLNSYKIANLLVTNLGCEINKKNKKVQ